MAQPTVVCLERRWPESAEPYVRCVALPGRAPGLGLAHDGSILWMATEGVACSLGISADEKLILVRHEQATAIRVSRAGRSLDVAAGKLVVLLHGDEVELAGLRWRVHVHGPARVVAAPRALPVGAWAAAAALAVATSAVGCTPSSSSSTAWSDAAAEASREAATDQDASAGDAPLDAPEASAETGRDADAASEAGAVEAGPDASARKQKAVSPPPARKERIEVRDMPPYVE